MKKSKYLLAALLTLLAIASRLLPHPPNFTALGAGALFGGSKIGRPYNYLIVLIALVISDYFIGFHDTMPFVYAAFIFTVALGELMPKKFSATKTLAFSLLSSTTFFVITNLGVWFVGGMYPHTLSGLISCFVLAIPFYGLTILGDALYSLGLFGVYEFSNQKVINLEGVNEQR